MHTYIHVHVYLLLNYKYYIYALTIYKSFVFLFLILLYSQLNFYVYRCLSIHLFIIHIFLSQLIKEAGLILLFLKETFLLW